MDRRCATTRPLLIPRCHNAGTTALAPVRRCCFTRLAKDGIGLSRNQRRATEASRTKPFRSGPPLLVLSPPRFGSTWRAFESFRYPEKHLASWFRERRESGQLSVPHVE